MSDKLQIKPPVLNELFDVSASIGLIIANIFRYVNGLQQ